MPYSAELVTVESSKISSSFKSPFSGKILNLNLKIFEDPNKLSQIEIPHSNLIILRKCLIVNYPNSNHMICLDWLIELELRSSEEGEDERKQLIDNEQYSELIDHKD
ncbi:MAG: hypothetical protein MHMPM18_003965 [Marteilia pararefringens]